MDDGKRKRVRKRTRRSKAGAADESSATAAASSIAGPSKLPDVNDSSEAQRSASEKHSANISAQSRESGPSLSFYEKTNPHKPSALPSLTAGLPRKYTVSVAIPGSIVLNAQTPELQSRLAGNIARSCAIFNIDEIIVFDEGTEEGGEGQDANGYGSHSYAQHPRKRRFDDDNADGFLEEGDHSEGQPKSRFDPNAFLARILQYVETPQYLRKNLFPMHRDLRLAGLLPPLDCPHHLRFQDDSPFREGICVETPHWATRNAKHNSQCYVNVGLRDPIACNVKGSNKEAASVPIGARVTVRMPRAGRNHESGQIVSPRAPTEEQGLYWGYSVRMCASLSEAIQQTPYPEPYDLVIGTSERGFSLSDMQQANSRSQWGGLNAKEDTNSESQALPPFRHALIMFGGLSGLEVAVERDAAIPLAADEASQLFDAWINIVEGQGSRTIRTEEALLIALSRLRPLLDMRGQT